MDKRLLLFWPWFVECAFQQHYNSNTLDPCDRICLPLDIVIWVCCALGARHTPQQLLWVAPGLLSAVCVAVLRRRHPNWCKKRRTAITAARRLMVLPYLAFVLLRQPLHATGAWQAAVLHLLVLSGGVHNTIAAFFFLNPWWVSLWELALGALVLGSAAPATCKQLMEGTHPDAGWRSAAALMDHAALNIYSSTLEDPKMAHAVCCTTLNTMLVTCSCLAGYLVHCFERQQRLRYKAQLPPAVAAMQGHLYGLPAGLVVAQALLLLLHPAMVIGWVTFGACYGLLSV